MIISSSAVILAAGNSLDAAASRKSPSSPFQNLWRQKEFSTSSPEATVSERAATTSPAAADSSRVHKLRKAASEFEALLLSNWWHTMKESGWSADGDDADPAKDTLDQMGIEAVSQAVADGGGFGIAKMLVHSLLKTMQSEEVQASGKVAQIVSHVK